MILRKPHACNTITKKQWSFNDSALFTKDIKQRGKHFSRIQCARIFAKLADSFATLQEAPGWYGYQRN